MKPLIDETQIFSRRIFQEREKKSEMLLTISVKVSVHFKKGRDEQEEVLEEKEKVEEEKVEEEREEVYKSEKLEKKEE